MIELYKVAAYAVLVAALFFVGELIRKTGKTEPEFTRKLAHISCGLVGISFIYTFNEVWAVALLTGLFALVLYISQKRKTLNSIHGVSRETYGAPLFPVAVGICFYLQNALQLQAVYVTALLTLSLADPAAAITGSRFPLKPFREIKVLNATELRNKSVGGCIGFLLTALLIAIAFACLSDAGSFSFGAACFAAFAAMLAEALSIKGTDNLNIPVIYMLSYSLILN
ncbi:MAG: hypothetical protein V4543_11275 [Bacteroidota bacterium]